jgi:hypothetical protein
MKKLAVVVLMLAGLAIAQQPGEPSAPQAPAAVAPPVNVPATAVVANTKTVRQEKPSRSDVNCAGFLTRQEFARGNRVVGGWNSPHAAKFVERDIIYLEGSGYKDGELVYLVRELRDPNRYELFKGQKGLVKAAGQPYADLGHARIIGQRSGVTLARVQFSCEQIVPGDLAIPYFSRPEVTYMTRAIFDRFPPTDI